MRHLKLLNKQVIRLVFFDQLKYPLNIVGVDAYEASLELGADGAKKGRKLGKSNVFSH